MTRWLSLVRRRRDPKTGRILGNLYVLHDEPLTPFEAMQLDPDYLSLMSQALAHAAKAVQIVGMHTFKEIAEDPLLNGRTLSTPLQVLAQRMARHGWTPHSCPQDGVGHDSEEGQDGPLRNVERPSSEFEAGPKPASDVSLRNPKEERTVRKDRIDKVRTVPRAKALQNLRLKDEQQAEAMIALPQVEETQRQAVLDEWAMRCRCSTVRNPAGYLFGIIQKAIRGEFKAWTGEGESAQPRPTAPTPPSPPATSNGAGRQAARAYLRAAPSFQCVIREGRYPQGIGVTDVLPLHSIAACRIGRWPASFAYCARRPGNWPSMGGRPLPRPDGGSHAEQLPAKYGCNSWRQVVHDCRLFELRYRDVDGQRPWYRAREV